MSIENISITLNHQVLRLSDLENISLSVFSAAEQKALRFCLEWKQGKDVFELQTSGSTGEPKKIKFTREQLKASSQLTEKALGLKRGMTALACLDTNLVGGMMMLVRSMEIGMNLFITEPIGNPLSKIPTDAKIDFVALVPYQVKNILNSTDANRLNDIQKIIIGGGEVDAALESSLSSFTSDFYATYAMTETISHVALRKLNGPDRQNRFHALDGIQFTTDSRGCIVVSTDYLGKEPIITNDLVELFGPKEFKWLGRVDFVINSGAVKVIPEKVEAEIAVIMPDVRFFIHGFPHSSLGQQVCLVIESIPWAKDREILLIDAIKTTVSRYEVPKQIVFVEKFVLAGNEKMNRIETAKLVAVSEI